VAVSDPLLQIWVRKEVLPVEPGGAFLLQTSVKGGGCLG
jgi:hypothetical protein